MYVNVGKFVLGRIINSVLVVITAVTIYIIREKLDERKQKKMGSNPLSERRVCWKNGYRN